MTLGSSVAESDIVKGDLIFPWVGQVQIYAGSGQVIYAIGSQGYVVQESKVHAYAVRRIITGGDTTPDPGNDNTDTDTDNNDNNNNDNNNNDGTTEWVDSDSVATVVCSVINVRAAPSTSSEVVAEYYNGNTVYYDSIVRNSECDWVSYIAASGNRRYVCGQLPDGTCYLSPCP